jgi:hypothetical protein
MPDAGAFGKPKPSDAESTPQNCLAMLKLAVTNV